MKKTTLIFAFLAIFLGVMSSIPACEHENEVNMPIVLLTDYGSDDYRISQLKGIIYTNNKDAELIDASHSVPAFDISDAAFILDVSAKEFPENVVFIAIVAPYTQPVTKYLVLTTDKNQIFILPDNGLLTYVAKDMGIKTIYEINNQSLFNEPLQDLVAERIQGKIGALIASGYNPKDVGSQLDDFVTLDVLEPVIAVDKLLGTIIYIDHYGNVVTNIPENMISEFGAKTGDTLLVTLGENVISVKFGEIYSDVAQGEEIMFPCNNLGMVQLSINLGNFADTYGVQSGVKIEIEK